MKEETFWSLLAMGGLSFLVVTGHPAWLIPFIIGAWGVITLNHDTTLR